MSPQEVEMVQVVARAEGVWAAVWAAEAVREKLRSEARRHGAQRDAVTALDSAHEIPKPSAERKVSAAGSSPAILSRDQPQVTVRSLPQGGGGFITPPRSWKDLEPEERMRLGAAWSKAVPAPAGFDGLSGPERLDWLNKHWPLDQDPPQGDLEW